MSLRTKEDTQRAVQDLCNQGWAVTALAVAAERGLIERLAQGGTADELAPASSLSPRMARAVLDVLVAIGLARCSEDARYSASDGLAALLADGGAPALLADLRSTLGQHAQAQRDARETDSSLEGWRTLDPVIVEAQARLSMGATQAMIAAMFPRLGVVERLSRKGAAALDVGAGAAGVCIALCRAFPELRVVGVEPAPEALDLARRNVAQAGLGDRVELRAQGVEDLADDGVFDFVHLAQMFIPDDAMARGARGVYRALAPGGWLVTAAVSAHGTELAQAVSRFRGASWGGGVRFPEDVVRILREAGFAEPRTVPMGGTLTPIIARRAPE